MKTISFRITDKYYDKLMDLKIKWNESDSKLEDYEPYTTSDIIKLCIGMIWEMEFKNSEKISLTNST